MIDRFYRQSEPDVDAYEPKPIEDIDVPDFTEPDPPLDPAEHAAQDASGSLLLLSAQINGSDDFDRVMALWTMVRQIEIQAAKAVNAAAAKVDAILERRR